jgi:hypothetical protein
MCMKRVVDLVDYDAAGHREAFEAHRQRLLQRRAEINEALYTVHKKMGLPPPPALPTPAQ